MDDTQRGIRQLLRPCKWRIATQLVFFLDKIFEIFRWAFPNVRKVTAQTPTASPTGMSVPPKNASTWGSSRENIHWRTGVGWDGVREGGAGPNSPTSDTSEGHEDDVGGDWVCRSLVVVLSSVVPSILQKQSPAKSVFALQRNYSA